jgi:hypothetical protein
MTTLGAATSSISCSRCCQAKMLHTAMAHELWPHLPTAASIQHWQNHQFDVARGMHICSRNIKHTQASQNFDADYVHMPADPSRHWFGTHMHWKFQATSRNTPKPSWH